MVASGATVLTVALIGFLVLAPRMSQRVRTKRRLSLVAGTGDGTGASVGKDSQRNRKRDIQARLKDAEKAKAKSEGVAVRYRKMLRMAGLKITLQQFLLICVGLAVLSAIGYLGLAYLLGYYIYVTIFVAVTIGFGVPYYVVRWLGKRRVGKFTLYFADAVDVIVRGVRSGLPVGECLSIIANESPEPVSGVFREIVDGQRRGMQLEQALDRAHETMPTPEIRFFNIVLTIQSQTGGNLAETLSNLSSVLRARKKMRDKVQALSSEAKTSAMIIGSLPFLITLVLTFINFGYISLLFTEDLGQLLILGSLIWMSLGVFIMRQMINFDF
jgi:tight adherence protein B